MFYPFKDASFLIIEIAPMVDGNSIDWYVWPVCDDFRLSHDPFKNGIDKKNHRSTATSRFIRLFWSESIYPGKSSVQCTVTIFCLPLSQSFFIDILRLSHDNIFIRHRAIAIGDIACEFRLTVLFIIKHHLRNNEWKIASAK